MAEWLARQPQARGFESRRSHLPKRKPSHVGYGWRQWCIGSLSRTWVPGNRQRWQLYSITRGALKRVSGCIPPRGVEQVMDITGLPGIIICKALWASFGKEKALYKNCILLLLLWSGLISQSSNMGNANLAPLGSGFYLEVVLLLSCPQNDVPVYFTGLLLSGTMVSGQSVYSDPSILRPPMGRRKCGHILQVVLK